MYINKLLKKQLSLSAASLFLIVFVILGSSYALFENTQEDTNNQSMNVGDLVIAFNNSSDQSLDAPDALNINGMNPMSDEEGLASTDNIYTFTIKNTGTIAYTYTIALADNPDYLSGGTSYDASKVVISKTGDTTITESERPTWKNIHMNLKGYKGTSSDTTSTIITKTPFVNKTFDLGNDTTNGIVYSSVVNPGESHSYKLQTWLAYDTTLPNNAIGSSIHLNIKIDGSASDNGYQITNLVTNGGFEDNNMENWSFNNNVSIVEDQSGVHGNYIVNNYHGIQYSNAMFKLAGPKAHKLYFAFDTYTGNKGNGFCYGTIGYYYDSTNHWVITLEQDNLNIWEKKSYYEETSPDLSDYIIKIAVADTSATDQTQNCYADHVILVDLTETFGAGNEPDKTWCDANIDWFEGSKIIYKF